MICATILFADLKKHIIYLKIIALNSNMCITSWKI